ncbi:heme exporter protein CcmD [Parasaccharibacter sp. TMW2.1885]|uniref:heme exporter protein CcmD n=1 Tax=Parasaccharibacter sp. TMW2.1885 TaxID=2039287 RepID=UPI002009E6DC|nr:heme exporter protein CcmD [Parasaccharibacter sp. TMW2.1885]MCK8636305.1 heme exporter protein CcmD [Parasaccharibacter sp. TMW2.1885]
MTAPAFWPSHWGFVLASYGLVIVILAVTVSSSLLRLRRAKRRLALMQRLQQKTANLPAGQERD